MYGGDSSEWEISVLSGQNVASHINRDRWQVYEVFMRNNEWRVARFADGSLPCNEAILINKNDFSFFLNHKKIRFDVVLVMIHGTPGENGILQAYFESLHIPFTSSSSAVSSLAFDKYACKCALRCAGISMAKDMKLKKEDEVDEQVIVDALGLPLFIKPNSGGSSFGAAKVVSVEELKPALERTYRECPVVLIEEFVSGRELTNGMLKTATQTVVLPVTEIVSNNSFFDYQAKYQGACLELTPAPISNELTESVHHLTSKVYDSLGCKGFVRVDYIVKGEEVVFLEINTIPGMTQMSLVPQQITAAGLSMTDFLDLLIQDALYHSPQGSCSP